MSATVVLLNPKFDHNVGAALRACAVFGATTLRWTGPRVQDPRDRGRIVRHTRGGRLPREERMKAYESVDWQHTDDYVVDAAISAGLTPVCIEVSPNAENLIDFNHPEKAAYIFGPEDSGVPKGIKTVCHRFVCIPSNGCLNLAAAVNVVLYDRTAKHNRAWARDMKEALR